VENNAIVYNNDMWRTMPRVITVENNAIVYKNDRWSGRTMDVPLSIRMTGGLGERWTCWTIGVWWRTIEVLQPHLPPTGG